MNFKFTFAHMRTSKTIHTDRHWIGSERMEERMRTKEATNFVHSFLFVYFCDSIGNNEC